MENKIIRQERNNSNLKDYIPDNYSIEKFVEQIKIGVEKWRKLYSYYTCALMEMETKFRVLNQEFSLQYDCNPIESIKTRIKSPESLAYKMQRKNIKLTLDNVEENINDVAGIRVICSFPKDIYMLKECLEKQDDIQILCEKDYIKEPKANGYRGLHLIVEIPIFLHKEKKYMKVEVQLRTIAMDFWASLEHKLRYKKNLPEDVDKQVEHELFVCSELSAILDLKMQRIKTEIENVNL
jgi:hypothetical protein